MELLLLLGVFLLVRWGVNRRVDGLVGADFDRLDLKRNGASFQGRRAIAVLKARHCYPHKDLFLPMPSCDVSCLAVTPEGEWFDYLARIRGLKLIDSWVESVPERVVRQRLSSHPALYRYYFGHNAFDHNAFDPDASGHKDFKNRASAASSASRPSGATRLRKVS